MDGLLGMGGVRVVTGAAAAVLLLANMGLTPGLADTIDAALVRAYQNNPQLNAQRAQVRFTDENVPQALSGYRPRVAITASAGTQYTDMQTTSGGNANTLVKPISTASTRRAPSARRCRRPSSTVIRPRTAPVWPKARFPARARVCAFSNKAFLLSAATVYMDYLRDAAIVEVQRSNVRVLEQTLKQTRDRFNVGEVPAPTSPSRRRNWPPAAPSCSPPIPTWSPPKRISAASSATSPRRSRRVLRSTAFCRAPCRARSISA